ncbi:MAG: hypothetical protein LBQ08_01435 [Holosporaceae bacterium]|jgi:hypothetical protein|nr:hypothetical protein [Holosporaceae bacterium]
MTAINNSMVANISKSAKNISDDMENGINIRVSKIIPKRINAIAVTETNTYTTTKKKINAKPRIMTG